MTMAFYTATGHENMGPRSTCVSNHSPSTYMFHVLSKMKPVAKIKYLIALPLSKHTSQLLAAIWWWERMGALASWGCPAREGPSVIHPTSSICFTLGCCHTQMLTYRDWCGGWHLRTLGLAKLYRFKTWLR